MQTKNPFLFIQIKNTKNIFLIKIDKIYEEDIDLKVFIYVLRAGAGDSVASTTESRALALANEVIDQLSHDATINGAVLVSRMRNMTIENTLSDEGRVCVIEMDIEAEAETSE